MKGGMPEYLKRAIAEGRVTVVSEVAMSSKQSGRRESVELIAPSFMPPATWIVPLETRSEANGRDWRARSRRSGAAWKAVRAAVTLAQLAPVEDCLRHGRPVRCRLTRLGGRALDRMDNLPTALKGVADALCYLLGIDDGNPLWLPVCDQEPGGPMGVRIQLLMENAL